MHLTSTGVEGGERRKKDTLCKKKWMEGRRGFICRED
jgi:hypothetical protein